MGLQRLEYSHINCPYCGEVLEVSVDLSGGDQAYIEDCQVCCQPIEMRLSVAGDGQWQLDVGRDDQ